ncbi:MAG: 1-phosphofructokinase family hexose kinase [Anaerolineae bacterium]|nr:1-phosphofructokinase family hexose kinase [Anaerolineae bacterium]
MIYTLTLNPAIDKTILVDAILLNGVNRASCVYSEAGGKGFNVSRALMRLGIKNCAFGVIGGNAGSHIQEELSSEGMVTEFVFIAAETRTNIVIRDEHGTHIKINEKGPGLTDDDKRKLLDLVNQVTEPGDIWVLSGSLPEGMPDRFYQYLTDFLHQKQAIVVLDTSGRALAHGIQSCPDLIKPNLEEAQEILGGDAIIEDCLAYFHDAGIPRILLSLGEQGLIYSCSGTRVTAVPPEIEAVNEVGAGDAALAGAVFGLVNDMTPTEIAAWACACGTAAASSASNCFADKGMVERILGQVKVGR